MVADALANNRAIAARLQLGMHGPPNLDDRSHYDEIFNHLSRCTHAQIAALEAFAQIEWRE
jgi:hypothetical protein